LRLYYGSLVSLIVSLLALSSHWTAFILTLPLPLYFLTAAIKQKTKNRLFYLSYTDQLNQTLVSDHFSIARFFLQPNLAFRFSLILLLFSLWLSS